MGDGRDYYCIKCTKVTVLFNMDKMPACFECGGLFPLPNGQHLIHAASLKELTESYTGAGLILAAFGDVAPAGNGGWFEVYMRKLLTSPIQYPIEQTAGKGA